jgi:hypothetical protein
MAVAPGENGTTGNSDVVGSASGRSLRFLRRRLAVGFERQDRPGRRKRVVRTAKDRIEDGVDLVVGDARRALGEMPGDHVQRLRVVGQPVVVPVAVGRVRAAEVDAVDQRPRGSILLQQAIGGADVQAGQLGLPLVGMVRRQVLLLRGQERRRHHAPARQHVRRVGAHAGLGQAFDVIGGDRLQVLGAALHDVRGDGEAALLGFDQHVQRPDRRQLVDRGVCRPAAEAAVFILPPAQKGDEPLDRRGRRRRRERELGMLAEEQRRHRLADDLLGAPVREFLEIGT